MFFLPISLTLFILFLILFPVLLALAPAVAFAKLGLNPVCGYAFFLFCLLGSSVNIPVLREKIEYNKPLEDITALFRSFYGIRIPTVGERVIAVNLGGAVLPTLLSLYLLLRVPLAVTLVATTITSSVAFMLSKPIKGVGVVMPAFVPPVISAIVAPVFDSHRQTKPNFASKNNKLGQCRIFGVLLQN